MAKVRLVFWGVVLLGGVCWGGIITVDDDGLADYNTIQAALDAAGKGDVIVVSPGTYSESGNRDLDFQGKAVTIKSTDPLNPDIVATTVIDCGGTAAERHRGFVFQTGERANSILDGLTITHGYAPTVSYEGQDYSVGGGIFCDNTNPTITRCRIIFNSAGMGGGIFCWEGSASISECSIENNVALDGGGGGIILVDSSATISKCIIKANASTGDSGGGVSCVGGQPVIKNCVITSNTARNGPGDDDDGDGGGIACDDSQPEISNCLITHNAADSQGGGAYFLECADEVLIKNCTFTGNTGNYAGVGLFIYDSTINLVNCVLWNENSFNWAEIMLIFEDGDLTVDHCNIRRGEYGVAFEMEGESTMDWKDGNIEVNPMLTFDGHLLSGSPCINAGTGSPAAGETDINGEARKSGVKIDMGADEFIDTDGDGLPDWWETLYFGSPVASQPSGNPDSDNRNNLSEYEYSSDPLNPPLSFYVNPAQGNDSWNGKSAAWDGVNGPKATIQAAIDIADAGEGQVILAAGAYIGPGNRDVDFQGKMITVQSTNPPNAAVVASTIIDCQGSTTEPHRGFKFQRCENQASVLDGVTIINGYGATEIVQPYYTFTPETLSIGGGIYCRQSSPTIRRCVIRDCYATDRGGGIYVAGGAPITDQCIVNENSVADGESGGNGGGIACWAGDLTIEQSTISDNTAGPNGGGVYCRFCEQVTIANSTISGNAVELTGGGFMGEYNTTVTIDGCSVSDNTSGESAGGIFSQAANANISNCSVTGNEAIYGGGIVPWETGATIDNCTISNNTANSSGGAIYMHNAGPTISNCTMSGNLATGEGGSGGAVYARHGNPEFIDCIVSGNSATNGSGFNLRDNNPEISNCTFNNNSATQIGGAINCQQSSPVLSNCLLSNNSSGNSGGGIYCWQGSPTFSHCTFSANQAFAGGAGRFHEILSDVPVTFNNCHIIGNSADVAGGLYWGAGKGDLTNCRFCGNQAQMVAAIFADTSQLIVTNCTLADNLTDFGDDNALKLQDSTGILTNSIIRGDGSSFGPMVSLEGMAQVAVSYCLVQHGQTDVTGGTVTWGSGNIDTNPEFASPGYWDDGSAAWVDGDYRLTANSSCIDAGNGNAAPPTDIVGNSRHDDTGMNNTGTGTPAYSDIGAYEYQGISMPSQGTLSVYTSPVSGEVFVNGVSWGMAPQSCQLAPATYTISFGPVTGYVTPGNQQAIVEQGKAVSVTGIYTQGTGILKVATTPVSGMVYVDGILWGPAPLGGTISSQVNAGSHTVSFGTVTGYETPAAQVVIVDVNQTVNVTGIYQEIETGVLSIDTSPVQGVVYVDGQSWGTAPIQQQVNTGQYIITFGAVTDYETPAAQQVTVVKDQIAHVTGVYQEHKGTLNITTTPVAGEVFVNSVSWGTAPQSRAVKVGSYNVTFGAVTGYYTPDNQQVTVSHTATTNVSGEYIAEGKGTLSIDTTPVKGEIFVNDISWGKAPQSGQLDAGIYTVSFGEVDGYAAPDPQQVTVQQGQASTITAAYEEVIVGEPMTIVKLTVKADKVRSLNSADSFAIKGSVNPSVLKLIDDDIVADIDVTIRNALGGEHDYHETLKGATAKKGKINYRGTVKFGAISSFKLDLVKGTFSISAKGVNLGGLFSPVKVEITCGDFYGVGYAAETESEYLASGELFDEYPDVINGGKSIPMLLQMGYADALRVTRHSLKLSDKPDSDTLRVSGEFALDEGAVNLAGKEIIIHWGNFEARIPGSADGLYLKGTKFLYKKPKDAPDQGFNYVDSAYFDLGKSTFMIMLKKASIGDQGDIVNFNMRFDGFDQNVLIEMD